MSIFRAGVDVVVRPIANVPNEVNVGCMIMRIGKAVGLLGLGAAIVLVAAILMGWPPSAASSPEVTFTVHDRDGESNSGRAVVLDFANAHRFTLLGPQEEAMKPDTMYSHQLFRLDSHIFFRRGFRPGQTDVDFRTSIIPWGRSAGEVRRLAHTFVQQTTSQGFLVETRQPDE